ncbi:hypothetical protein ACFYUV_50085 [Nonomuraea sp. NPDC003560]|uniref:hypothetical protein n=1 Tax=Nonomuraea sp. NPDC003560 TaxID=3364341 RepID=UPI0036867753
MVTLRQTLQDTTRTGVISQATVGLGGVGKSELALQWWIDRILIPDSPYVAN